MKELISSIGTNNFIILIIVVSIIIVILVLAIVVDNRRNKRKYLEEINKVQELIDTKQRPIIKLEETKEQPIIDNEEIENNEENSDLTSDESELKQDEEIIDIEKPNINNYIDENIKEPIYKQEYNKEEITSSPRIVLHKPANINLSNLEENINIIENIPQEKPSSVYNYEENESNDTLTKEEMDERLNNYHNSIYQEPVVFPTEEQEELKETPKKDDEVIYDEHEKTQEEAKKELEEITMKLAANEDETPIAGHTKFEEEQEEISVISYDELKKMNWDTVDETNDRLLKDNGDEPITIEELYKRHLEEQEHEQEQSEDVDNPMFEDTARIEINLENTYKDTNFKNSELISPVYGILEKKKEEIYTKEDFEKAVEPEELETEIKRTEDFLKELHRLKSRLNK